MGGEYYDGCSAILISTKFGLTSGHCALVKEDFDTSYGTNNVAMRFRLSEDTPNDTDDNNGDERSVKIMRMVRPTNLRQLKEAFLADPTHLEKTAALRSHDIAVFELENEITTTHPKLATQVEWPVTIRNPRFSTGDSLLQPHSVDDFLQPTKPFQFVNVGHGKRENSSNQYFLKPMIADMFLWWGNDDYLLTLTVPDVSNRQAELAINCAGDSGGPLMSHFLNNGVHQYEVYGLISGPFKMSRNGLFISGTQSAVCSPQKYCTTNAAFDAYVVSASTSLCSAASQDFIRSIVPDGQYAFDCANISTCFQTKPVAGNQFCPSSGAQAANEETAKNSQYINQMFLPTVRSANNPNSLTCGTTTAN